jgi:uncharacterized NAD-dependent epimerase/dehydratase family protein
VKPPQLVSITVEKPYLILIGDEVDATNAKTGIGLVHWRPDDVAGQLRFSNDAVDLGIPDLDIDAAIKKGVASLVIGVAPIGGTVPDEWWDVLRQAASAGLNVIGGLHTRLNDNPMLCEAAAGSGAQLIDVRVPPKNLPVGSGIKRGGMRILTVGTDCAIGKKYAALSLHAAFKSAGLKSTYRATGQTGIIIAGEGMPIDAVVADFISGAAEVLSPDNDPDHWDIIEGQGSLFHPAYSGVSLGLLHGSQPDGFVVCHDATRKEISGWEHYPLPTIEECIVLHEQAARRTNPDARCVGICVNTSSLDADRREPYLEELRRRHNVPAVDPLIDGCDELVTYVRATLS